MISNRSGTIVEVLPHHQYLVKLDGSNHVTRRNRRFLRRFEPALNDIVYPHGDVRLTVDDSVAPACPPEMRCPPDQQDVIPADISLPHAEMVQGGHPDPVAERSSLPLRRLQPHNKPGRKETSLPLCRRTLRSGREYSSQPDETV